MISEVDWRKERIVALIWWCGDEDCDCHQPMIERITPNLRAGYPWIKRERVWSGTFASMGGNWGDGPTYEDLKAELKLACEERGIQYS